jgi:hypothetical protein
MTFDDQLKRAFDTLSDRLRTEVDRQVAEVMDDLAVSARAERERVTDEAREAASREAAGTLDAAVAEARDQAHAAGLAAGRAEGLEEGRRQGREEARDQGLEEGRHQGLEAGRRQGVLEGREEGILEGRQQGVLYGRQQAEEEGRQAIAAAVVAAQASRVPAADGGGSERLAGAIGSIGRARSLSEILDALVTAAVRESAHADVWLVRGGQLRKWRAGAGEAEMPLEDAGTIGDAVRSGTAVISGREVAVPIAMAGEPVAVLAASGTESTSANAAALDVLTRYAARSLETITAFKTAHAVSERGSAAYDGAMAEEEASARRYARLLVSEIKLYHEPAVVEGRRDRDLATRLGGEIARARVLYEERVPPHVRHRADYFRDELVRTLANGDATLLHLT